MWQDTSVWQDISVWHCSGREMLVNTGDHGTAHTTHESDHHHSSVLMLDAGNSCMLLMLAGLLRCSSMISSNSLAICSTASHSYTSSSSSSSSSSNHYHKSSTKTTRYLLYIYTHNYTVVLSRTEINCRTLKMTAIAYDSKNRLRCNKSSTSSQVKFHHKFLLITKLKKTDNFCQIKVS